MGGLQQEIQQLKAQQAELLLQNQQLQKQLSDSQDDCSANVPKGEKLSPSPAKALTFPSPDKETSTEEVIGLAKEMATSSPLPLPSQTKPRPRMKLPTGPESEKFYEAVAHYKASQEAKAKRQASRNVNVVASDTNTQSQDQMNEIVLRLSQNPNNYESLKRINEQYCKMGLGNRFPIPSDLKQVQVCPVGAGGGLPIAALPLYQHMVPPVYSGKLSEWNNFRNRWEGFITEFLHAASDKTLLEILRKSLDEGSKDLLETCVERNSFLTNKEFWTILNEELGKDVQMAAREA